MSKPSLCETPCLSLSLSLSHTHTHTHRDLLSGWPASRAQEGSPVQQRQKWGDTPLEAESDMFVFVGCSLTKCLKWANESGAYPAKLLLDGAESAQMFYDTPVMRFHIDLTALSRTAGSSLFSILTHAVRFRLPFIWLDSVVLEGLSCTDRWPSISLQNIISHSETPLFSWCEQEQGDRWTIFGEQEEFMSKMHAGRSVSVHYV